MANLRWYDKDRYLSAFMTLLETLDSKVQSEVALDILKEIPKVISMDCEAFMLYVEKNDPKKYNRWYDKNPHIHKVVEAIRLLSEAERESLYVSISDIMQQHTELHLTGLTLKK
ncbi:MAG: hypothetical protein LUE64_07210 [Candidatus Gastranaerophilales bacterium]|nr:hypothetical protein [Candidatus Gastranaerophilales bacterium]